MGFIRPIDVSTLPQGLHGPSNWTDNAGNEHFTLQTRKPKGTGSVLTGLILNIPSALSSASSSSSNAASAALKTLLDEADCRILLKCTGRKNMYVVCLEDGGFENIRPPWNWIESELLPKVSDPFLSPDQRDSILLRSFEQVALELGDPKKHAEHQSKLFQMSLKLAPLFKNFRRITSLLNYYPSLLISAPSVGITPSANGDKVPCSICLAIDDVLFYVDETQGFSIPYRVICEFHCFLDGKCRIHTSTPSEENSRRGEKGPTNGEGFIFIVDRDVARQLGGLIHSAMNRLVKGADYATAAAMDMFDKGNATGDLGSGMVSKTRGILGGSEAKADYGAQGFGLSFSNFDEEDGMLGTKMPRRNLKPLQSLDDFNFNPARRRTSEDVSPSLPQSIKNIRFSEPVENFDTVSQSTVGLTMDWVDAELRNIEFRRFFRLSHQENILFHEPQVVYFHHGTFFTGNLYLSSNFLCFSSSTGTPSSVTSAGTNQQGLSVLSLSSLAESSSDTSLSFVIPLPQVVSVSKQPPTKLPTTGITKFASFSISGYLVISTFRVEFWLCFPLPKIRDRVSEEILTKMKAVDTEMMNDFGLVHQSATSSLVTATALTGQTPSQNELGILQRGLLFTGKTFDQDISSALAFSTADEFWTGVLKSRVINFKEVRQAILSTPISSRLRGSLWLWWSGAQWCKPGQGYYNTLMTLHRHTKSTFAEEIEKDVKRSLPEHPAYQTPLGLGALRNLLLQYSWRNPTIGYTQAFNIISSLLLLFLKEEDAFSVLCTIVEHRHPDHYTKTLIGSLVDQDVFSCLVQQNLPALFNHFDKIYLDLSTMSVPWFLCLFLNTVSYEVGILLLDGFSLDSSKFLFWIALAVLKINETVLLSKRDDEQVMTHIKQYFASLKDGLAFGHVFTVDGEGEDGNAKPVEESSCVNAILSTLFSTAYQFAPIITSDVIQYLRLSSRCRIVARMEATNRKVQVRNVQEQVSLSVEETGILYDFVRATEYYKESAFDLKQLTLAAQQDKTDFDRIRDMIVSAGAWGFANPAAFEYVLKRKTILLKDFRDLFDQLSLWGCQKEGAAGAILLADRVYFYLCYQYNYQRNNKRLNARLGESVPVQGDGFTVDLASFGHYMDTIMKQPLNSRLRFLFDIHDLNGDGNLNEQELKAVMDTLLSGIFIHDTTKAESYLMAISNFVNSAYQFGSAGALGTGGAMSTTTDIATEDDGGDIGATVSKENSQPPIPSSYRLNFNEFMLAMLSQPVFVHFFESKWSIKRLPPLPTGEAGEVSFILA